MSKFDKTLRQVIDAVADDALSDETKVMAVETIKQAVDEYVIGKDETSRFTDDPENMRLMSRDVLRDEQRKSLWGDNQ